MNISDNDLRFIFSYLDPQYHSDELTEHENLGDNFESKWESKQDEETEVRIRVHIGSSLTASNESACFHNCSEGNAIGEDSTATCSENFNRGFLEGNAIGEDSTTTCEEVTQKCYGVVHYESKSPSTSENSKYHLLNLMLDNFGYDPVVRKSIIEYILEQYRENAEQNGKKGKYLTKLLEDILKLNRHEGVLDHTFEQKLMESLNKTEPHEAEIIKLITEVPIYFVLAILGHAILMQS